MFLAGQSLSAGMKTAGEALRVTEGSETPLSHLSLLPPAGALHLLAVGMAMAVDLLVAGMMTAGADLYFLVAGMTMAGEALRVMKGSEMPF